MIIILLSIIGFAGAAAVGLYAARLTCSGIEPLEGGPPAGNPHPRLVIAAAAILGAFAASRGLPPVSLAIFGTVSGVLAAIWYADLVRGIVPDIFTLMPLAAIVVAAMFANRWVVLLSAIIPVIPFAIVALMTRGRGMGWGDAKLAALGGALLGMEAAVLAFALASVVAIVAARFRPDRTRPIAFAPYLVLAIALPLALQASAR